MIEGIPEIFAENFSLRGELGASVSIWKNGRELLSLAGGFCDRQKSRAWTASTPVLVWSATKGLAAACVLHCLEKRGLTLEMRVADCWPEFASAGKEAIAIGEVLSHRAGLAALAHDVSVFDYDAVIDALAHQAPSWPASHGHGYHPRTFGFLLDEIVRRLSGITLGDYWRQNFAKPLRLDTWIGMPESRLDAVSPMHASRTAPEEDAFLAAFNDPASLTNRAFASPRGLHSASSMNTPEARTGSFAGFGGISTAASLGKFYAMLANGGELDGRRFFSPHAIGWMATPLASGPDKVLQMNSAFSAGFMQNAPGAPGEKGRAIFGPSPRAFGQPGAGGSVAFADPENRVAFAYVMNQMEPGVLPNEKSRRMIDALYA